MIAAIAMVLPHTRVMEAFPLPSPDSNSLVVEGQSESRLIGEEHPGPLLLCPWQIMSRPGQTSSNVCWVRRAASVPGSDEQIRRADQTSSKCAWVRRAASVPGSDEQARPAASVPGLDEQQVCLGQTCSKCAWVRRASQTSSKCARVRRAASVPQGRSECWSSGTDVAFVTGPAPPQTFTGLVLLT